MNLQKINLFYWAPFHKYGYPSLKEEGGIIHVMNITYAEHVFYDEKFSKNQT